MNITDCVFELEKLKKENAVLRQRLAQLVGTAKIVRDGIDEYWEEIMFDEVYEFDKAIAAAEVQ